MIVYTHTDEKKKKSHQYRKKKERETHLSPKLINDGVSRFDSSFMTTSMPFRRAKATTFDFDPKSIPATDMIFILLLFFFCVFFLGGALDE